MHFDEQLIPVVPVCVSVVAGNLVSSSQIPLRFIRHPAQTLTPPRGLCLCLIKCMCAHIFGRVTCWTVLLLANMRAEAGEGGSQ